MFLKETISVFVCSTYLFSPPRITVKGDRRFWPHPLSQHVVSSLVDFEEKEMADENAEGARSSRRRKV